MSTGLGVLISDLAGNRASVETWMSAVEKTITNLVLDKEENQLQFTMKDGTKIALFDDGQSCCEYRYMTTDDNLDAFVGSTLLSAEVRDVLTVEGEYGDEHEIQFLLVTTSLGVFTIETHNEHNGYYGGFAVRCKAI